MKNLYLRLMFVAMALIGTVPSFAEETTYIVDLVEYRIIGSKTMEVSRCHASGEVTVLGKVMYDGKYYEVTSIGEYAFAGCGVTKVILPNTIETIEDYAFGGCNALTSIKLNYGIDRIGAYAFCECTSLGSIQIPSSVKYLGEFAFQDYSGKVIFAGSVPPSSETFYSSYFAGSRVREIELLEGATTIGEYAFAKMPDLESIKLPSTLREIKELAFKDCPSLKSVHIIDMTAWCSQVKFDSFNEFLGSAVNNNPLSVAGNLYLGNELVTDLVLSVDSIKPYAFKGCKSIKSITLKNGVKYLGDYCLHGTNATTLVFPTSISVMGEAAIGDCPLVSIHIDNLAHWCSLNHSIRDTNNGKVPMPGSPRGLTDLYLNGKIVKGLKIPAGTKRIGAYTFDNISIESVDLGNGIDSIGDGAFSDTDIDTISFPGSLKKIGRYAFSYTGLRNVTIPSNVEEVGDGAFSYCYDLSEATMEEGVKKLGRIIFDLTKITELVIPNSVEELPLHFIGDSITDLVLSDNIKSLQAYTIIGFSMNSIKRLTIGKNTKNIQTYFFPTSLEELRMRSATPPQIDPIKMYGQDSCYIFEDEQLYDSVTLYVPTGSKKEYQYAEHWKKFANIVEFDITGINEITDRDYAFSIEDGCLHIENAPQNAAIEILALDGRLMYKGTLKEPDSTVRIDTTEKVLIVRINGKAVKIGL